MNYNYQQLIGGAWLNASNGRSWDVLNPATEEVVRTVPFGQRIAASLLRRLQKRIQRGPEKRPMSERPC
jgi:acyl-CoA reductase-like NAD-dependent aldehyde dehydrogenase